ncbi:MAG: methyltransferase domain-containing protein [Anaerolineales bacterium]|nr:methyltransferase domain-containing protein [Anaerolineales bacterium]
MLNKILFHRFPKLKSWLTRLQYEFVSTLVKDKGAVFMNFGYTAHHQGAEPLELHPDDEYHRYPLQLYHHVAKHVEWKNVEALEVSSGRGGGANFIMRYFKPKSYVGVDFSQRAIEFCRNAYQVDGLQFQHGNAEDLKFPDNTFDVVVNVEASLYYPNIEKFFGHVKRVLKPGGYFLYTDLRYEEKLDEWHKQLKQIGWKVIKEEDITENVLKALEMDREQRIRLAKHYAPKILHKLFYEFQGLSGNSPKDGMPHLDKRRYWYFVLQNLE